MPLVAAYHRPDSLDEALSLLTEPNRIPLGGGTVINADREPSDIEVVDLQAVGLSGIEASDDRVRLGAMAALAAVMDSDQVPTWLRVIAQAEAPSSLRTRATVGGCVASASGESVFLAALLAADGQVELAGGDDCSLTDLLDAGVPSGAIITSVTIDPSGVGAQASTARTPADVPIVAAVARVADGKVTLALTGVAAVPRLVDASDPTAGLSPVGDFRGSPEYRLEMAGLLGARAVEAAR